MSELTINSEGKIKFFGNIASFYALLIASIKIVNRNNDSFMPKDEKRKLFDYFISKCNELRKEL